MSWLRVAFNKEPYLVLAGLMVIGATTLPAVIPAYRRSKGLDTYILDHDVDKNPYLSNYYENKAREPDFKDYDRISAFLQKHPDPYRE